MNPTSQEGQILPDRSEEAPTPGVRLNLDVVRASVVDAIENPGDTTTTPEPQSVLKFPSHLVDNQDAQPEQPETGVNVHGGNADWAVDLYNKAKIAEDEARKAA